ncbi:UDP-N-acetylglucosamine--N-acetylmuramyl-(pentapeptide) pyrophosphoryl-undecaprenol N-acetylglucosamine transferase [Thiosulfativibrio zosterae]|uniref:UDP-N-acetylglucosamine--N-acetylmuramyl-(pentapeptide) pyrophosphoryl-undecaprenol N-acetylglucosamine transferase n=2 Tax=Thiosulfativibrio zosterae TaxID=2675053 RepID=A0A6F8PLC6_9GAMM|nr:UDP-N-acetylglucosamine--N-acetylmuramyl-(pentapeptide) pyrophosphoryl-undecaprenol N-acetylglucosamine transferase [Thiosulfativibrio zosterae]
MIMAGGTGGHVFPGIAIGHALQAEGVEVIWLGTQGGLEQGWVSQANIPLFNIAIRGLRGNGLLGWLAAPFRILRAWWQARKIMQQHRPDLVLGMGGFVCGPGGLAAKSLGVPLVIHEQNAIPGLTNKRLAPWAVNIITAFEQKVWTGQKVLLLGNPVRAGFEQIPVLHSQKPLHILVVGGSRGALALNDTVPKALALLPAEIRPTVTHQTGAALLAQTQQAYADASVDAEVVTFIDDMVSAYEAADLVVCRSGALTVSELMAAARPALMVPYPHAVDDHQTANAQALVGLNGGEVISQAVMTPELLAEKLMLWLDVEKLNAASKSIREQTPQQATQKITQLLLNQLSENSVKPC